MDKSKTPPSDVTRLTGRQDEIRARILTRKGTKVRRILAALARGEQLTRFDAEKLGDHCLPSTVSSLERCGIRVDRQTVQVPGFTGKPCHCAVYWLDLDERARAHELLSE
jgi:hypothetical protein